jgi:hypothetical protein
LTTIFLGHSFFADVHFPILRVDFLQNHHLCVDPAANQLGFLPLILVSLLPLLLQYCYGSRFLSASILFTSFVSLGGGCSKSALLVLQARRISPTPSLMA